MDAPALYNRGVSRTRTLFELAGVLLLLSLVCLYAASPIFSIDFFWHLKLGEVIRQTGAIPRVDLFSAVHPERPYVQFNWLWQLCAAWIENAFGLRGIRVAQSMMLGLSFAVLYATSRRALGYEGGAAPLPPQRSEFAGAPPSAGFASLTRGRAASGPLAFAFCSLALVLFEDRFRARPSALALGFVAAMLPLLLCAHRVHGPRHASKAMLLATLALSVLWTNLHGGESVLLVLSLGALFAGELVHRYALKREDAAVAPAAQLLLAALLGFLSSPTLIDGFSHWLTAVGPQIEAGNEEWQPSYTMLRNGWRPAFILIGLGPTAVALAYLGEQIVRVRRYGRAAIDVSEWLICAGYLVLSHQAVRNSFLCLLPLLFMVRRVAPRLSGVRSTAAAVALGLVLLGVSFEDAVLRGYGGLDRVPALIQLDLSPGVYPEHVATFMEEAGIRGRVLNDGKVGGYLIWRTWPRCHVFADSRHDFTPEMWPIFIAAQDSMRRPIALRDGFARYGLELAVFRGPTFPLHLPKPGWQLLFKAGDEELYQNQAGENADANIAATRAWLREHGVRSALTAPLPELAEAATRIGAAQWMRAPYQVLLMNDAEALIAKGDASEQATGRTRRGILLWQAGLYAEALRDFEATLAVAPNDIGALYHAALCYFVRGDLPRAKQQLKPLARLQAQLPRIQRARMAVLDRALRDVR